MKIIEGSLLVAISSAAVLVFLTLGFRPAPAKKSRQRLQLQSARLAAILLVLVALLLGTTTVRLVKETAVINNIHRLVRIGLEEMTAAEITTALSGYSIAAGGSPDPDGYSYDPPGSLVSAADAGIAAPAHPGSLTPSCPLTVCL
jgi:hypothetical protein